MKAGQCISWRRSRQCKQYTAAYTGTLAALYARVGPTLKFAFSDRLNCGKASKTVQNYNGSESY